MTAARRGAAAVPAALRARNDGDGDEDEAIVIETAALEIAMRTGLRFLGLRGLRLDDGLFEYLPYAIAVRERVVALALAGHRLQVASATSKPELSFVADTYPDITVDIVISPLEEILNILHEAGGRLA